MFPFPSRDRAQACQEHRGQEVQTSYGMCLFSLSIFICHIIPFPNIEDPGKYSICFSLG